MPSLAFEYAAELALAAATVHRASVVTKQILRSLDNEVPAETKADASPVTAVDFAAQALIIGALHSTYPEDKFVGEEDAEKRNTSKASPLATQFLGTSMTKRPGWLAD